MVILISTASLDECFLQSCPRSHSSSMVYHKITCDGEYRKRHQTEPLADFEPAVPKFRFCFYVKTDNTSVMLCS